MNPCQHKTSPFSGICQRGCLHPDSGPLRKHLHKLPSDAGGLRAALAVAALSPEATHEAEAAALALAGLVRLTVHTGNFQCHAMCRTPSAESAAQQSILQDGCSGLWSRGLQAE